MSFNLDDFIGFDHDAKLKYLNDFSEEEIEDAFDEILTRLHELQFKMTIFHNVLEDIKNGTKSPRDAKQLLFDLNYIDDPDGKEQSPNPGIPSIIKDLEKEFKFGLSNIRKLVTSALFYVGKFLSKEVRLSSVSVNTSIPFGVTLNFDVIKTT